MNKSVYACMAGLLSVVAGAADAGYATTSNQAGSPSRITAKKMHLAERYGRLPLGFEANRGQTDSSVRFVSRGNKYTLFLAGNEAVLSLRKTGAAAESADKPPADSIVRMKLVGANTSAAVTGIDELPGKSNYFIGNDPRKWRTNVPNYAKVKYQAVYPGVDLIYYGNQSGHLEYDFAVAPGTDPAAIRFAVGGASRIDPSGDLIVETDGGEVRLQKPLVYQRANNSGRQTPVDGRYILRAGRQVGFELGAYDHTQPLVIDPVLTWSTFLGGSNLDAANSIAVDSNGNAYVTGRTASTNFPTANPWQGANKATPNSNVFIAELNSAGAALVYSTYLGGSGGEQGEAIAVDSSGDAYVTGQTVSSDFPTVYSLQSCTGSAGSNIPDAFVAEVNPGGSALLYSTYLGGVGGTQGTGIAADSLGNAYVTGYTLSSDFPIVNGYQTTFTGSAAAFVTKLNFNGAALTMTYSTYLGGNNVTQGLAIATDSAGDAYVTGFTTATNFPTMNPAQPDCGGCSASPPVADAFVAELNAPGSALVYSTYLGGSSSDTGRGIAVDSSGSAYVTGFTSSTDFPTVNPFQAACGKCTVNNTNAFVAKLNSGGSALVYSTYLGGNFYDQAYGIAVDSSGNAYVTGMTESSNFPTLNPIQSTLSSYGEAAFVTELNAAGSALVYSTYLGGNGPSTGQGIAVDTSGNTYVTGSTGATTFPTADPIQAIYGGGASDAFVAKMAPGVPAVSLSATSLTFAPQDLETTSSPQLVTLTNTGGGTLAISSILVSGDFAMGTNTCGSSVSAGGSCAIGVTFTPNAVGTQTGTLTINDSASGSPHSVGLTGAGLPLTVTVSPASLSFGPQTTGSSSAPQTVTITNTSTAPVAIFNFYNSTGDFTSTTTCGSSVGVGASCTISVTFTPAALGKRTDTLTIDDDATPSPQLVGLTGTGIPPTDTVSPTSLSFGNQTVGSASVPQTVTLTNTSPGVLTVSKIAASGDFAQTNNCGSSVGAGASCTISVTFTPGGTGTRTGSLTITDNATSSPQSVALTGNGILPTVTFSPTSLSFGNQTIGSTSAPQMVTVTNTSAGVLALSKIVASGDFAETNNCGSTVAAGTSCAISVTFTPATAGTRTGILTITGNVANGAQSVGLNGTGIPPTATVSPDALSFGSQAPGTTSAPQTVTLTNTSVGVLMVSKIAALGDFAEANNCGSSVSAGAHCTISVTFTPTAAGPHTGVLVIYDNAAFSDNAAGHSRYVRLTGTGTGPAASVSPTSLSFGSQAVGTTSAPQKVTLTNTGVVTLTVAKIAASDDFAETNNCGSSVSAGASCTISVTFTPQGIGKRTSTLYIDDNVPDTTSQYIPLTGTGTGPMASVSPASLSFGPQAVGTTSVPQSVTLTNTGAGPLAVSKIAATDDFAETNNCGSSVAAGTSCTISVTFTPITAGPRTGTLFIDDNAAGNPQSVGMTGTGSEPPK